MPREVVKPISRRTRGDLAIVLHSHMPYVEGYGTWPFGEEWLWEAVACVYLPLLDRLHGARVTISLTPVLCDQLEALRGPARGRFESFLRDTRARLHEDDAVRFEQAGEPLLAKEARRAAGDYAQADRLFAELEGDVLAAFARLAPASELWTSAATHAILPLLATPGAMRLQVRVGIASHIPRFGSWQGGFWLPECAYAAGLEYDLEREGVTAFCVDQTNALGLGSPDQLEPIATAAGPVAVPIDWEMARLVWDGPTGYPGAPPHRDYENATDNALKLWSIDGGPYDHRAARELARRQGREFLYRVGARLDDYRAERKRSGLVCFALDTEILGHWWYEGLEWLDAVLSDASRQGINLVTLPAGLARHTLVARPLTESSWGRQKDFSTWDSPAVADLTSAAREAELLTVAAARHASSPVGIESQALERAARELLALQASDWAFMRAHGRAGRYPDERVAGHLAGLALALGGAEDAALDAQVRNLAPVLDVSSLADGGGDA